MVGQSLSHYYILEQITQGGMEEVYLAEDIREHRKVVLKVLPTAVRREPERMRRIRTDVEAAIKLHHPNIVRIYSIEQGETQSGISQHFITMEYVEGQLLSRIIPSDGLPITRLLGWFTQLADALDEAHKRRVTHRDLKPENIIITGSDIPKIMDYGLARIIRPDLDVRDSQSHTRSVDVLRTLMHSGAVLDGIAYMSPEQAEGRAPDHRTDIYSFGAMLYHTVTGIRPFVGESYVDLVSSIMRDEPEAIAVLKPAAPYLLNQTIITCLQKDVRQRYQSMEKVGEELEQVRREVEPRKVMEEKLTAKTRPVPLDDEVKPAESSPTPGLSASLSQKPLLPTIMLLAGILLTWVVLNRIPATERPVVRKLPIDLSGVSVDNGHRQDDESVAPLISPDGKKILFIADERLWIRDTEEVASIEVPETFHAEIPFWAPGSDRIGYFTKNDTTGNWTLYTLAVEEQESVPVCEITDGSIPHSATWRSTGDIVYSASAGESMGGTLYSVSANGGLPSVYLAPDVTIGETALMHPSVHPDGASLMYAVFTDDRVGRIVVYDGTERKTLISRSDEILTHPMISKEGYLIYQRGLGASHTIWAAPLEGTTTGTPLLVTEYGENPSISDNDVLIYHADMPSKYEQLIWIDRHGHITGFIGQPQERIDNPTISPDGHRVAVTGTERGNTDIWVHEGYLGQKFRVTRDAAYDYFPVWSPSGAQLAFSSVRNISSDIFLVSVEGTGRVLPFVTGRKSEWVASWSRDGGYLAYEVDDPDTKRDIWYIPMDGDRSPRPFLETDAQEFYPNISADGEYVAYQSDESGQAEIYISRFPSGRNKTQVSTNGGTAARWTSDGSELFYIDGAMLMAIPLDLGSNTISAGPPEPLFSAEQHGARMLGEYKEPAYDVAPDGQRFVMVQRRRTSSILMVENWHLEFEGK